MKRPEARSGRIGIIVVSLLWALALWFYAAEEMSAQRDIPAVLTVVPSRGRFVYLHDADESRRKSQYCEVPVVVTVKGPRGKVAAAEAAEISGRKALDDAIPPGPLVLSLSPSDFAIPDQPELKVVAVRPLTVSVIVAETASKIVPVRVIPVGRPAKGFYISDKPRIVPEQVEISASPELLGRIDFIETEPVDVEEHSRSFSVDIRLKKTVSVDGRERTVFLQSADRVIVFLPIAQEPVFLDVPDVPLAVLLPPGASFNVVPASRTLSLKVRGPEPKVASLSPSDIKVFADASRLSDVKEARDVSLPIRVVPPEGIHVLQDSYPAAIQAKIVPAER
ncbi:MAG TPA: hypothetical protein ENN09_04160 [Planctomycetes bacterium]|nr:hypothetical protein [Planctomycetota bacterium]